MSNAFWMSSMRWCASAKPTSACRHRMAVGCVCSRKPPARSKSPRSELPPATPDSGSRSRCSAPAAVLTTFEIDAGRAQTARDHFRQAGVDSIITVVEGDAHANITSLKAPLDAVFIDAEKSGYMDYWKKTSPLVRPGGLLLAHNVGMTPHYVAAVTSDPNFDTVFYMEGNDLAVTLKKA